MTGSLLFVTELEKHSTSEQIVSQLGQLLAFIRSSGDDISVDLESSVTDQYSSPSRTNSRTSESSQQQVVSNKLCDIIVNDCIRLAEAFNYVQHGLLSKNPMNRSTISRSLLTELSELFIRLLSDDTRRIEAYLHAGKLKLAYLLSVSVGQRSNVVRVLDTARQANDQHYVKICEMWLKKNAINC